MENLTETNTPEAVSGPNKKRTRRIVLAILLGLMALGVFFAVRHVDRILNRPEDLFTDAATPNPSRTPLQPAFPVDGLLSPTPAATPTPSAVPPEPPTVEPALTAEATAAGTIASLPPTREPTPAPVTAEPTEAPPNILNVMLMGIDAFESGGTSSGTMPHTDVNMVIAINFDQGVVDLISIPRDFITTAPDHHGYYKFNGVFNVGLGGWYKPEGRSDELADGFLLTCRAAEQWLGGISIPYYYGVDFQAVIDIVDAIGGIDYDVDQEFPDHEELRWFGKGMRHLDGSAVLGYLRIRHKADGLDSSRTARQRRMMVAIFNKLKTEGKLSDIPALITATNSGIYTNTTLSQTTALVNYAMNLTGDKIRTRAMFGEIGTIEFDFRYAYVDQQNRIDLIREVYGIEAEPMGIDTRQYERWLHSVGLSAVKYLRQAEKALGRVQEKKDAGYAFTDEQIALYGECYRAYVALQAGFDEATATLSPLYAAAPWRERKAEFGRWTEENVAENQELVALEQEILAHMQELLAASKAATLRLADTVGLQGLTWSVAARWWDDPDINQVFVQFG